MLALAMVVAGATLLLALLDAAAKASLEGWPGPSSPTSRWPRSSGRPGRC